jgi:hypothetical protein
MKNVADQKIRLEQKKNRLIAEETRLKLKERKMRTRHLIELGGLITKADLDCLPTNTLYGALLSIVHDLETNQAMKDKWTKIGKTKLDLEQKNNHAVILKFEQEQDDDIRKTIRNHGLKWNKLRCEWYGHCANISSLKKDLGNIPYQIEEL